MAYNRPIVTNRVGEVAEALGDAGFYYHPNSTESMACACERALCSAATYDLSHAMPLVYWSERARCYGRWLESLKLAA